MTMTTRKMTMTKKTMMTMMKMTTNIRIISILTKKKIKTKRKIRRSQDTAARNKSSQEQTNIANIQTNAQTGPSAEMLNAHLTSPSTTTIFQLITAVTTKSIFFANQWHAQLSIPTHQSASQDTKHTQPSNLITNAETTSTANSLIPKEIVGRDNADVRMTATINPGAQLVPEIKSH